MKHLKRMVTAILLVSLVMLVIPAYAQEPVPPISPEAQKEVDELLAQYQQALDYEVQHGLTAINPSDGKTRILVGESAEKIDILWNETQSKIETIIARPASEREPVAQMIEKIDGEKPTYLRRWHFPYNADAELERYQTERYIYTVDIATSQIVEIMPADQGNFTNTSPLYSQSELETKARDFIRLVDQYLNLDNLYPAFGDKNSETFFFRWEDPSQTLPDGTMPFIQVGFSSGGDFLNYINTLPVGKLTEKSAIDSWFEKASVFPQQVLAAFNEVYANGSTTYWTKSGTLSTVNNAGYCYTQGSWCTPKNFYWQYTYNTPPNYVTWGKWLPTVTSQYVSVYTYIPSTNATAKVKYRITWNTNWSIAWSNEIDQNIVV